MYLIALKLAKVRGTVSEQYYSDLKNELTLLPEKIKQVLGLKSEIQKFASEMMDKKDVFFIGRGIDYAVSIESSLKLKEISYIHSEAYAAGELKHGTISLIEEGTLVLGILTQKNLVEKTVSNLVETASRGAYVAVLASENVEGIPYSSDGRTFFCKSCSDCNAVVCLLPQRFEGERRGQTQKPC